MALRLSDYVVRGELNNTKRYSTFGYLELAGVEGVIMFSLTGDCAPDLRGRRIFFEAAPAADKPAAPPPRIAGQLIGVTGQMTAAGWVKTFNCSTEEFLSRAKLGEAPPTTWARRLYLEFYCQHGRTVIELAGPLLADDPAGGIAEQADWQPLPETTPPPTPAEEQAMDEQAKACGPEIILIDQAGEAEHIDPADFHEDFMGQGPLDPGSSLQRQLDAQAAAIDRAIRGEAPTEPAAEDEDALLAEMELMDDLITTGEGDPLALAFQGRRLPRPEQLTDEQVETLLKSLLAELALHGVALHVCEHYSPRDAYRLLLEKMFREWTYRPQLIGTGWTQNYMTSEHCPACEEEAERDYEELTKRFEAEGEQAPEAPEPNAP